MGQPIPTSSHRPESLAVSFPMLTLTSTLPVISMKTRCSDASFLGGPAHTLAIVGGTCVGAVVLEKSSTPKSKPGCLAVCEFHRSTRMWEKKVREKKQQQRDRPPPPRIMLRDLFFSQAESKTTADTRDEESTTCSSHCLKLAAGSPDAEPSIDRLPPLALWHSIVLPAQLFSQNSFDSKPW